MVDPDLQRRVADYQISLNDIPVDSCIHKDPIGVSGDDVVLYDIVGVDRGGQTDAEVKSLGCISISTDPVRTEPVAYAAGQSYTAAGSGAGSIAYGNIADKLIVGSTADQNARSAIRGSGHVHHRAAGAVDELDTVALHLANHAGSSNGNAGLRADQNTGSVHAPAAGAAGLRICKPGHGIAVQSERNAWRADGDAGAARRAGHIAGEFAVFGDGQSTVNGSADLGSLSCAGAHNQQRNERRKQC